MIHAMRSVTRSWGFTVGALATIVIGAGVNAGFFSVLDVVMTRRLPIPEIQKLAWVEETQRRERTGGTTVAALDAREWNRQSRLVDGVGIFRNFTTNVIVGGQRTRVATAECSKEFFSVLGLVPRLGRWFSGAEENSVANAAILDEQYWMDRYGGDTTILGKTILIADWGFPFTIVGIAPRSPVWKMLNLPSPSHYFAVPYHNKSAGWAGQFFAIAKLKPDVTTAAALSELQAIDARLAEQRPDTNFGVSVKARPLADAIAGPAAAPARLLWLGSLCISLMALLALAQLVSARATARSKEIAVRMALGAGTFRGVAPLIAEISLVAVAGGLVAIGAAWLTAQGLALYLGERIFPFLLAGAPAGWRAAAAGVVAGVTMLVSAIVAIRRAARGLDATQSLAGGARVQVGGGRWSWALSVEMAVTMALVVSALTLVRTARTAAAEDLGFDWRNCSTIFVTLARSPHLLDDEQCYRIISDAIERIGRVPDVVSVASSYPAPAEATVVQPVKSVALTGMRTLFARDLVVAPNFFEAMRMRLVSGRLFSPGECPAGDAAVVNESFARRAWPNETPLGKLLVKWHRGQDKFFRVVGVVADIRDSAVASPVTSVFTCDTHDWFYLTVRTSGTSPSTMEAVTRELADTSPLVSFDKPTSMDRRVSSAWAAADAVGRLLSGFAAVALALAAVAIFAGTAYVAARRSREFGIRSALGANRRMLASLALRGTLWSCAVALLLGVPLSLAAHRMLAGMLFGSGDLDLTAVAGAALALTAVSLAAAAGPAMRAASVDPAAALRSE